MSFESEKRPSRNPNGRGRKPSFDPTLVPKTGSLGKRGEPISLAEEIALEQSQGHHEAEKEEDIRLSGDFSYWNELQRLSTAELIREARQMDEKDEGEENSSRSELIFRIIKQRIRRSGLMFAEGTLEILPDEFGFIRNPENHFLSCSDDIYISPSQVRRFGMRNGSTISGQIRPPKENERYFALLRVAAINHEDPNYQKSRPHFEEMTPTHPDTRLPLEKKRTEKENSSGDAISGTEPGARIVDLLAPIAFGQRGLIIGPAKSGKTRLLRDMVRNLLKNDPDIECIFLLPGQKEEEIQSLQNELRSPRCEVIGTSEEEPDSRHLQVADIALDKAKRMVEYGKNVVFFIDTISQLVLALHRGSLHSDRKFGSKSEIPTRERIRKFSQSARKFEEGGSLTLIATLPTDPKSPEQERIVGELQGNGQFDIYLDGHLSEQGIYPAIDIRKSVPRREDALHSFESYHQVKLLRKLLESKSPQDALPYLLQELQKFETNEEFLFSVRES